MRFHRRPGEEAVTVSLDFRVGLDRDWMALGQTFFCVRLVALVEFSVPGGPPLLHSAILDTGSPLSIVPRAIWERVQVRNTESHSAMRGGLSGEEAAGELGFVPIRLTDTVAFSPEFTLRALLLQDDSVPLVLGFGDLLTRARLHCDFPRNHAHIEFPRRAL